MPYEGNKHAITTEDKRSLQPAANQSVTAFVQHLSIRFYMKCSAVFLTSCSPVHNRGRGTPFKVHLF